MFAYKKNNFEVYLKIVGELMDLMMFRIRRLESFAR
jgi:hypothetical protein